MPKHVMTMERSSNITVADIETNIAYLLSLVTDRLMRDVQARLKEEGQGLRHDKRKLFNDIKAAMERVIYLAGRTDDDLLKVTHTLQDIDGWLEDANETARLLLLYGEKCGRNPDNANLVFKFLRSLDGAGIIGEDDIDRFRIRKIKTDPQKMLCVSCERLGSCYCSTCSVSCHGNVNYYMKKK